jgi:hypothetical protein
VADVARYKAVAALLHEDMKRLAISDQHVAHELAKAAQVATHFARTWEHVRQVDDAVQQRIV